MQNDGELIALKERIIKQLEGFYNGQNWVADNLEKKIFYLTPIVAMKKVEGHSHSIAELVRHITAWRNFVVQKLTGNDGYDIEIDSADWPEPAGWDSTREEFAVCHQNIINAISNFPVEKLGNKVPGRNYSFMFLINGIVEHDYYHYGQIGSVLSAINKLNK